MAHCEDKCKDMYEVVYEVASNNYGFVTAGQAQKLGIDKEDLSELVARGKLDYVVHDAYRVRHYVPKYYGLAELDILTQHYEDERLDKAISAHSMLDPKEALAVFIQEEIEKAWLESYEESYRAGLELGREEGIE